MKNNNWVDKNMFTVETPYEKLNRFVECWNSKLSEIPPVSTKAPWEKIDLINWCSLIYGTTHRYPVNVRKSILEIASVLNEVSSWNSNSHLMRGRESGNALINDNVLWLILSTAAYIKETGGVDVLEEQLCKEPGSKSCLRLSELLKKGLELAVEKVSALKPELPSSLTDWVSFTYIFESAAAEYIRICEYLEQDHEVKNMKALMANIQKAQWQAGFNGERLLYGYEDSHSIFPMCHRYLMPGEKVPGHLKKWDEVLSGAQAWNFVIVTQRILGIKPGYDGLVIDPCIPLDWKEFKIFRSFRGAHYKILVKNAGYVSKEVQSLKVDGTYFIGNTLPVFSDGREHEVEVVLG